MGFCDEWTNYIIPDEELDDEPNALLIYFSVYNSKRRCSTYGIIPNVPSLCRISEEDDAIKNDLINRPKYVKKKHLTKMPFYIDEFHKVHSQPILKNYAYHRMLLCVLGKHESKNLRR